MFRRVCLVLSQNKWKREQLIKDFTLDPAHVLYEPNGVDIERFSINETKVQARKKLNLPEQKKLAVYTGHLYGWKGVQVLGQAARNLPANFLVVFVGGTDEDVTQFRARFGDVPQIVVAGHHPPSEIPLWQKAADVLILPNTATRAISNRYTSPMKLFEYMASGTPVIASDIPSLTEILHSQNACLVVPDDPDALAHAIVRVVDDPQYAECLAAVAFNDVRAFTWHSRALRIIEHLRRIA